MTLTPGLSVVGAGAVDDLLVVATGVSILGVSRAALDVDIVASGVGFGVLDSGRPLVYVGIEAVGRGSSILSGFSHARITPVMPNPESIAAISYTLTLTGSPDIIIPISSWQMRRRDDGNAWLSCVAPGATPELIAAVSERIDGNLILRHHTHMLSGAVYIDTVLDVAFSEFRYDRGTKSASMTLTSNVTRHNADPQTRPVWGETYRGGMSGGVRRARFARVDPELQPGDTVLFADGESWVVGSMTTWVGPRESNMELAEAET